MNIILLYDTKCHFYLLIGLLVLSYYKSDGMVGGATKALNHRIAQIYIECFLTSGESVWTPAIFFMAR